MDAGLGELMPQPTILFDGDNTLWECGKYYDEIIDAFVLQATARTKLPRAKVKALLDAIDVVAAGFPNGFHRSRFPRALRAASLAADSFAGLIPDVAASTQAEILGDSVFDAPYTIYDGAYGILEQYMVGWTLVIVTKGDHDVQTKKIRSHRLDEYVWHWEVVGHKTVNAWREVLERLARMGTPHDPARTWVVGDSMRDDITPAIELGLGTIHVANGSGNWGWETTDGMPHDRIQHISELPSVLPINPDDPMAYITAGREELARTGA